MWLSLYVLQSRVQNEATTSVNDSKFSSVRLCRPVLNCIFLCTIMNHSLFDDFRYDSRMAVSDRSPMYGNSRTMQKLSSTTARPFYEIKNYSFAIPSIFIGTNTLSSTIISFVFPTLRLYSRCSQQPRGSPKRAYGTEVTFLGLKTPYDTVFVS